MTVLEDVQELEAIDTELNIRAARENVLDFTCHTFPQYEVNWHHKKICDALDNVVSGDIKYLILEMPPRHGKSELVSRRLPAYVLGKNPDEQIISCSYSATLAQKMNRDVQRIMNSVEYQELFPDTVLPGRGIQQRKSRYLCNNDTFEIVDKKGSYVAAGADGGIGGMGFNLGLIDDPIKNNKEAKSETYRDNIWEWYVTTFYTRMEKVGRVILVSTRWHEDDLIGRVLNSDDGINWTRVCFPAICEDESNPDDPRKEGEALWPGKYPIERLEKIKGLQGHHFQALYQQRPSALEGEIYKREYWSYYDMFPNEKLLSIAHSWDTAFKKGKENAKSALIVGHEYPSGLYLTRVFSGKMEFPELDEKIRQEHERERCHACLIEDKASGQSHIQVLKKETSIPVVPIQVHTDKESRAQAVTPQISSGNVLLPRKAEWVADFVDELAAFPNSTYKDLADALSQLLDWRITHVTKFSTGTVPEKNRTLKGPQSTLNITAFK